MLGTSFVAEHFDEYIATVLAELNSCGYIAFYGHCAAMLTFSGFTEVKLARDYNIPGMHIWAEKEGISYAVICTRSKAAIPCNPVQQAMGACSIHSGVQPMVMSTGLFSRNAIKFARESNPPVFLFNRDDCYNVFLRRNLRAREDYMKRNARVTQNFGRYVKYTTLSGDRFYMMRCRGAETIPVAHNIIAEIWKPNLAWCVNDIFDNQLSTSVTGLTRESIRGFLESLFMSHGRLGVYWIAVSRAANAASIAMPQFKSGLPGDYYIAH